MLEYITLDIINFTDIILSEYDRMLPFRMIAFNRIKYVIQTLFYLPDDKIKYIKFLNTKDSLDLVQQD